MHRPALLAGLLAGLSVAAPAGAQAPAAPSPGPGWLPRGTAELQGLDKVYARGTSLTVKNGQTVAFGTLRVTVAQCLVRPPDQAADATAYFIITDANATAPVFQGWMFANNPALAMLAHPIYDIRLTACKP
jgi:hypothetical protein